MKIAKRLLLAATLAITALAVPAQAVEFEAGVGIHKMHIDWIGNADYAPEMFTAEGTVWTKYNIGLRAQYGKSNRDSEGLKIEALIPPENATIYPNTSVRVKHFYSLGLVHKASITDSVHLEYGIGYMQYDQAVRNFKPDDNSYSNVDEGVMYSLGVVQELDSGWNVRYAYQHLHSKSKWNDIETDGRERTRMLGISVTKSF